MYQGAYTSQSWAAQLKKPQNRIETVGRQACEAAGSISAHGIALANTILFSSLESMAAIAMAVAAGGGIKASKAIALMTGAKAVEAMKKAGDVMKVYRPAT